MARKQIFRMKKKTAFDKLLLLKNYLDDLTFIYQNPYENNTEELMYLYCHNTKCTVYFGCSTAIKNEYITSGMDYMPYKFVEFIESEVMGHSVKVATWETCDDYDAENQTCDACTCKPFEGNFGYSWGVVDKDDFKILLTELRKNKT